MGLKVSEIKPGMRGLRIEGRITSIGEVREVNTRFGPARVATAVLEDETGHIRVNLWRSQIDSTKPGDMVRLINAFAREFGGIVELNIGKDGEIIVLQSGQ